MSDGTRHLKNIDSATWKKLRTFGTSCEPERTMGSVFTELVARFLPVLEAEREQNKPEAPQS